MSFQISIPPNRQAAARFVGSVRRALLKALMESKISQSDIARALGVHRSVIHRELKGYQDITLGRAAELAWALGKRATFAIEEQAPDHSNMPRIDSVRKESSSKPVTLSDERRKEKAA
jgi:plasmid maintenance system antidote protein VapI